MFVASNPPLGVSTFVPPHAIPIHLPSLHHRPRSTSRPAHFFQGLVKYGANGAIEPALATSWSIAVDANKVETVTFTLRENVLFHDGAAWTCEVAKLNFDHVFSNGLAGPDWHGWYSLPTAIKNTRCDANGKFIIEANKPYYPLMQELTYIRPLRMISPNAFVNGITTNHVTHNSCPTGWGTVTCWAGAPQPCATVTCAGTTGIFGTGPFKFDSRTKKNASETGAGDADALVRFQRHATYWGGAPAIDINIVHYDSAKEIEDALNAGTLDAVVGADVLTPTAIKAFQLDPRFDVRHTESIMNSVIILNIPRLDVRKTVVHAVNKGHIIETELGGIAGPVSQLFPTSAPYCDLDLVPKFGYDIEKAKLVNCPYVPDNQYNPKASSSGSTTTTKKEDDGLFLGLFIGFGCLFCAAASFVCYMMNREKSGNPIFTPLVAPDKSNKVEMA